MMENSQNNVANGLHMTAAQIAKLLKAEYTGTDVPIVGVSTDTRQLLPGQLFVALQGPNFDGHEFVEQAIEKGAVACLVERPVQDANCIVVDDTRLALGRLAAEWRKTLPVTVIGVTGSNGKTTVKEMLASILAVEGEVLATPGNYNNDIGMPLTLLSLDERYAYAVIEMGANHHGEIAYLTEIAQPDVALITNAGMAHLEGFGSVEGVAQAKGEIYQGLGSKGVAVVNNDDTYAGYWKGLNKNRRVISFGIGEGADVSADVQIQEAGQQLKVSTPAGMVGINLKLLGRHNVLNALASISAAVAIDIPLDAIKTGLERLRPVSGRLQLKGGIRGSRIIDDTYNANPTSLYAALQVLEDFPGRHYLALGDMGELGGNAESLHTEAGSRAKETGVGKLYTLGSLARYAARSFGEQSYSFDNHDEMIDQIKSDLEQDVTLLVKGSRLMHMEKIVQACVPGDRER